MAVATASASTISQLIRNEIKKRVRRISQYRNQSHFDLAIASAGRFTLRVWLYCQRHS